MIKTLKNENKTKKRIYMGIADTGGGHRSTAESITNYLNSIYNNEFEILIDNIFANSNFIGKLLEKTYNKLTVKFTFLYSIFYILTDIEFVTYAVESFMGISAINNTSKKLDEFKPHMVISLHPAINLILKKSIKKSKISPLKVLIITDPFTAHTGWFYQNYYDLYIVNSEKIKNRLLKKGVSKDKIKIYNPPLDVKFRETLPENEIIKLKKEYNLPLNKKIIFFSGSVTGFKKIKYYVKYLLKNIHLFDKAHFVIVIGKNEKQSQELDKIIENKYKNYFTIYGFTKKMYELTNIADIVICKGGPSTIFQALLLKKPIINNTYIYGQERGNVEMVEKMGYGKYIPNIKKCVKMIENLILNDEELNKFKQNVNKSNITNGSEDITKELIKLLESR